MSQYEDVFTDATKATEKIAWNHDAPSGLTDEQKQVWDALVSGANVFISGNGGTGKTYLIRQFIRWCRDNDRNIICCAPAGKAAQNMRGGVTLHRAFGIPAHLLAPGQRRRKDEKTGRTDISKQVLQADVIILDEISMCRIDVFDFMMNEIDEASLRSGRRKQLVLSGDFFQLPPVIDREDADNFHVLYPRSPHGFCFQSKKWREARFHTYNLTRPMRQAKDLPFKHALDLLRVGDCSCLPYFHELAKKTISEEESMRYVHLFCRNHEVDDWNEKQLSRLPGEPVPFNGIRGEHDKRWYSAAPEYLKLKVGARVMVLVNDYDALYGHERYANGSIGTVMDIDRDKPRVLVAIDGGEQVWFERYRWTREKTFIERAPVNDYGQRYNVGTEFKGCQWQFPLKLAYALTVHKAQGQTFDGLVVHPRSYAAGQLYVALSRAVDSEHLFLDGDIYPSSVQVADEVKGFYGSDSAAAA